MPPKFVPRERKHRKIARQQQEQALAEKDGGSEPKISGKKRKRLEKYIETKLKKEENLVLLKKLAEQKIDTSLLKSAKTLGRVTENKRERFQRALREREAGIDVNGDQESILFEERVREPDDVEEFQPPVLVAHPQPSQSGDHNAPTPVFGLGLKRPLEVDDEGKPIIKRRKRRKPAPKKSSTLFSGLDQESVGDEPSDSDSDNVGQEEPSSDVESEWGGFGDDEGVQDSTEARSGSTSDVESTTDTESEDDEDESSSEESGGDETDAKAAKTARVSAFKAWATTQRNDALGFVPSTAPTNDDTIRANFKPRAPSPDPEAVALTQTSATTAAFRPTSAITVARDEVVQSARLQLPVVQDEQKIMEAVHGNPVVVVCGATGSGKTTQIPQMLFENGYTSTGMIGITQPRRVAATSVASRVAFELGPEYGKRVAHQVRYDTNVGLNTNIKFMTDGVLLREISQDFVLSKYSALVIDEAHERSVNTDILIGMLSRIVPLRHELCQEQPDKYNPLKLIIMSATLRVSDFLMNDRLFRGSKPPLVQAEGRQYQVTEHFARRTQRDYVTEMVRKVSRGHKKLPPGGILVFLTGQDEIQTVAKQLRETFKDDIVGFHNGAKVGFRTGPKPVNDYLEDGENDGSDSEAEIEGLDDYDNDDEFAVEREEAAQQQSGSLKAHVLPLYAALPQDQQKKVFEPAPEGSRVIVLATNVAETSLTIPGIRYVFDCGRSKEKTYDISTGVQEFAIDWISKASASQRMGRAGRTGPGHCYRLYSSAIYEQYFEDHTAPEILRTPIESTVLQLKSMDVDNVVGFPFPTPPSTEQLVQAERLLKNLGAISAVSGKITETGRDLTSYPVNPRFGKMLLLGLRNHLLPLTIALVAGLAVGDLFIAEPRIASVATNGGAAADDGSSDDEKRRIVDPAALSAAQKRQQAYGRANATLSAWDGNADVMKLLTAVAAHAQVGDNPVGVKSFCAEYFVREKGMAEVQQLRRQLHNIMQAQVKDGSIPAFSKILPAPSKKQIAMLKQIVAGGYLDQVAIRADLLPAAPKLRPGRRAIEVPYRTILPSTFDVDPTANLEQREEQKSVYVHPSSVLARLAVAEMPAYVVYGDLSRAPVRSLAPDAPPRKTRMRPLTTVGPKQLAALAEGTPLLEVGKPIGKIAESDAGRRRECWVNVALRDPGAAGSTGWPLGAWKVVQRRSGKDWIVEKVISRGTT